jgi:hypothetical protein
MDALSLLTQPYEGLTLPDRAAALLCAREAGITAADMALAWADLESPGALAYQRHVVEYARDAGKLSEEASERWRRQLLGGDGLQDPRVQAFFFGWHERAVALMTEIAADAGEDAELRARWFLRGLKP